LLVRFVPNTNGLDFPRLIVRLKSLLRNLELATTETLLFENLTLLHVVFRASNVNSHGRRRRTKVDLLTLAPALLFVLFAAVAVVVVTLTVLVALRGPLGLIVRRGGPPILETGIMGFGVHCGPAENLGLGFFFLFFRYFLLRVSQTDEERCERIGKRKIFFMAI
jgi:hypothetical protein